MKHLYVSSGETDVQRRGNAHGRAPRHLRRSRRSRHVARPRFGLYIAAAVIAITAITAIGWSLMPTSSAITPDTTAQANMAPSDDADRVAAAENAVSRSDDRAQAQPGQQPSGSATAQPKPSPTKAPAPASPSPSVRSLVGGLTQAEINNAVAIIQSGQRLNLPRRAFVVAIATALQESHLRILANANLPESLNHPNEGVGYDQDSVGLFQQRPNWGTVAQLMDPHESAHRFYAALAMIPGWDQMAVTMAAQTVQVSAFPDAYAKWEALAAQIVGAVV